MRFILLFKIFYTRQVLNVVSKLTNTSSVYDEHYCIVAFFEWKCREKVINYVRRYYVIIYIA